MKANRTSFGLRLVLALALLLSLGAASAGLADRVKGQPGTVNIVIDANPTQTGIQNTITVAKGTVFTVNVWLQPQSGQAVSNADIAVNFDKNYITVDETSYAANANINRPENAYTIATGNQLGVGSQVTANLSGYVLYDAAWVLTNLAGGTIKFGLGDADPASPTFSTNLATANTKLGGATIAAGTNIGQQSYTIASGDQLGPDMLVSAQIAGTVVTGALSLTNVGGCSLQIGGTSVAQGITILGGTSVTAGTNLIGSLLQQFVRRARDNTNGYADFSEGMKAAAVAPNVSFPMVYIKFKADAVTPTAGTPVTFNTAAPRATKAYMGGVTVTGTLTPITVIIQDQPTAAFTPEPTTITAGQSVTFTDTSTGGPDTWAWEFKKDTTVVGTSNVHNPPAFDFGNAAGTYSVKLSVSNTLFPTPSTLTKTGYIVQPGTANRLKITESLGTSSATITAAGTVGLVVKAYDQYNNLLSSGLNDYTATKNLDFAGPDTSLAGNEPNVNGTNVVGTGPVSVSFTNGISTTPLTLTAYKAQTVTLHVSEAAISSTVPGGVGLSLIVNPSTANRLAFIQQPTAAAGATVDSALLLQPWVEIRDAYGNVRTADTSTVISLSAVKAADFTTPLGTLTGTISKAASDAGVAKFTGIGYRKTDTIRIKAESSPLTAAISSTDIALLVGASAKLAYNPVPGATQTAGQTWAQFKVEIRDQYDNLTASTAQVTLTPSMWSFATGSVTQKNASAGVATFSSNDTTDYVRYNIAQAFLTVTASSGSLSTAVASVNVGHASANKLRFMVQPAAATGATVDAAFATQPVVDVTDQYNNVCISDSTTVVALSAVTKASGDTSPGAGALTGTTSHSVIAGQVNFGWGAVSPVDYITPVGYTKTDIIHIKATSGTLVPATSITDITLAVGAAAKLAYNPAPATPVVAGQAWAQFKVEIRDQYDNKTTSTASVTVTPSAGSWGLGTATLATQPASAGVATFNGLKYTTATTITVTASVSGQIWTAATSGSILVNPDVLDHIDISPPNPTKLVQDVQQFTATGKDAYNNTVPSLTPVWSVPTAQALAGSINSTTGVFQAGVTPGTYTGAVQATSGSVSGTTNVTVQGATITGTVKLQGGARPTAGYNVPLTFKLYSSTTMLNMNNILPGGSETLAVPLYTMSTANGKVTIQGAPDTVNKQITFQVTDLPVGTFNVTLSSPHTLINLRNNQAIAASGTVLPLMGTLAEGNADDSFQVYGEDFSMLLSDYLQMPGGPRWNNGRSDFDRDGQVRVVDFTILSMNYTLTSPRTL